MVQINQVLNNNLNSMNNIARYVKTCGKKSILETKPFRGKFEPNKLGYILSDGTINFSSVKTAFEYGKNKCVQALNSSNPYEHGVIIFGTRVLEELVGTISSCPFIPMKYKTNITPHQTTHHFLLKYFYHMYFHIGRLAYFHQSTKLHE